MEILTPAWGKITLTVSEGSKNFTSYFKMARIRQDIAEISVNSALQL